MGYIAGNFLLNDETIYDLCRDYERRSMIARSRTEEYHRKNMYSACYINNQMTVVTNEDGTCASISLVEHLRQYIKENPMEFVDYSDVEPKDIPGLFQGEPDSDKAITAYILAATLVQRNMDELDRFDQCVEEYGDVNVQVSYTQDGLSHEGPEEGQYFFIWKDSTTETLEKDEGSSIHEYYDLKYFDRQYADINGYRKFKDARYWLLLHMRKKFGFLIRYLLVYAGNTINTLSAGTTYTD